MRRIVIKGHLAAKIGKAAVEMEEQASGWVCAEGMAVRLALY